MLVHTAANGTDNCPSGRIRLANGRLKSEGRVEVCVSGVWGTVCDQGWDNTDAAVVCGSLGYPKNGQFFLKFGVDKLGS